MRRRKFIALVGGAVVTWPLTIFAQQEKQIIGFLSSRSQEESTRHLGAFLQGLAALGFVDGQNIAIEYRWAEGQYDRLRGFASEFAAHKVTAMVATGGNVSGVAARAVTDTIPIVFIVGDDPVKLGLVTSLSEPGGNATGVSVLMTELAAKRFQLLHEVVPKASAIGLLVNPKYPGSEPEIAAVRAAAVSVSRSIAVVEASSEQDIDAAFSTLVRKRVRGLLVGADALFVSRREQIVALATREKMISIFDLRD
jgi:putative tryptophan/tyrosine transport system substrate-binding protein